MKKRTRLRNHGLLSKQEELDDALSELSRTTSRVFWLGLAVSILSSLNLFSVTATAVLDLVGPIIQTGGDPQIFAGASLLLLPLALAALLGHDFSRRRGDALFEEISNGLEWDHKNQSQRSKDLSASSYRTILRDFAHSANLPLIRGAAGYPVYLFINCAAVVLLVLLVALGY
jgi:hypothetical protein